MLSSIESEDNERIPTLKALTIGWRLTYIDAGDDLIVELPDDLLRATAWAEGDLLEMEADPADSSVIRVTKRTLCDASSLNTSETAMDTCRRIGAKPTPRACDYASPASVTRWPRRRKNRYDYSN